MLPMADLTAALHDELASHDAFMWVIGKATARAQRLGTTVAVVILDIHNVPDALDIEWQLGERLLVAARADDTAAQLGPGVFGFVTEGHLTTSDVEELTTRIGNALEVPLRTANGGIVLPSVRASITMLGTPAPCNRQ